MIRGVVYFLIVVLITIGDSFADESCTGTLGEQDHNCAAGEFWSLTDQDCVTCETGRYCPRISSTNNGIAYCCPEPFTQSDYGTTSIAGCYADITCENDATYQVHCVAVSEDPHKCALNSVSGGYDHSYYDTQWTYMSTSPIPKRAYIPKFDEQYLINFITDSQNENQPGYHIEVRQTYPNNPTNGGFGSWYWPGTPTELHCISNKIPCNTFRNFYQNNCSDYHSQNTCNTHQECSWIQTGQGSGMCINLDARDAVGIIPASATNCDLGNNLIGDAYWVWDTNIYNSSVHDVNDRGHWNVSGCKCDLGQNQWIEDTDNKCMKKGHKVRDALGQDTNAPINTVHSIYENVIFDTEDTIENTSAVCRRCLPDNPSQNKYYYVPDPYGSNPGGFVNGHVIYCSSTTVMGYYRPNDCSSSSVDWGEGTLNTNPCPRTACPAGKTTTEHMPIGSNGCKYTPDTKFCDAKGCFNITDAADGGWNWDY